MGPCPARHPGVHAQSEASVGRGIVTPIRYEKEAVADKEWIPLVLRKSNPISRIFFVNSSLQVSEPGNEPSGSPSKNARTASVSSVMPVAPASHRSAIRSRGRGWVRFYEQREHARYRDFPMARSLRSASGSPVDTASRYHFRASMSDLEVPTPLRLQSPSRVIAGA